MATHSRILAWRIPGTGEPGGLPSMGSHRVGHDCSNLAAAAAGLMYSSLLQFNYLRIYQNDSTSGCIDTTYHSLVMYKSSSYTICMNA